MKEFVIWQLDSDFDSGRASIRATALRIVRAALLFGLPASIATAFVLSQLNPDLSLGRLLLVASIPIFSPFIMLVAVGHYFYKASLHINDTYISRRNGPFVTKVRWNKLREIGFVWVSSKDRSRILYASEHGGSQIRFKISPVDEAQVELIISSKLKSLS